jgi:hypothetical protein
MIRSILKIGKTGQPEQRKGDINNRRAGRVRCEGIASTWGDLINASATGCRLRTKLDLQPGLVGTLTINGPDGPIMVRARVVWVRRKNWGKSEAGIQFDGVDNDIRSRLSRLADFASRDTVMDGLTDTDHRLAG